MSYNVLMRKVKSLKNRMIRWAKHHNSHYFLNPERVFTKRFQEQFKPIGPNQYTVGNYYLDQRQKLDSKSIIYSFGILTDINFDRAVSEKFGCSVHMFDPTPISINFMEKHKNNPLYKFSPFGVWTKNTILTFYLPKHGGSASAVNINLTTEKFEAPCKTVSKIMEENGHVQIDVLKMDIEGAALPIMEDMIKNNVFPTQVVAEFERPRNDINKNIDFFYRLNKICEKYEAKGYEIVFLPRDVAKYYSLEMLFVKK